LPRDGGHGLTILLSCPVIHAGYEILC
jgi:hypothetical protein